MWRAGGGPAKPRIAVHQRQFRLSAGSIGVNFRNPNDPSMRGLSARTVEFNKKGTGWDYAIPAAAYPIYQTLQQAIKRAQ